MALLSRSARLEITDVADRGEKVETAVEPSFQEHFVAAMGLPHTNHPFPHLAAAVSLPEPKPGGRRHDRRRGGRRREEKT